VSINLHSDTQTKPSAAMREAMAYAEVGDEQRGQDPSVNALCERVAAMLGQDQAVFLPSGTMANEISMMVHCRPGDEILCDKTAHLLNIEGGGPSALAGAMMTGLDGDRGRFTAEQVRAAVRPESRYMPRTKVVALEQTANLGGGTIWPVAQATSVTEAARQAGLIVHMDGARLLNATVALGVEPAVFGRLCDSVWIDLSKGLGCPVGAVLAGNAEFIHEVWRWKQRIGGAMRQAGILAAAGLYALDHHVERMADDHANALMFAEEVAKLPGVSVDLEAVQTNIVYFDIGERDENAVSAALEAKGADISPMGPHLLRAVTHMDVSSQEVAAAARIVGEVLGEF
jgi:threonine aldolase